MRKWLRRAWQVISTAETIRSLIQWIGTSKIISAGGTIAVIIWSALTHKPTPEIIVISIATFAVLLWTNMGIVRLLEMRKRGRLEKTSQTEANAIPAILTPQVYQPKQDAVQYLIISGREYAGLNILRGREGWPVQYPLKLYNTRPTPIECVGFTVNVLWNDKPIQSVDWEAPKNYASNGVPMPDSFVLQGDQLTPFSVPVLLAQISKASLPDTSPIWGAAGELRFRGDRRIEKRVFDFRNDRYRLSDADWNDLRKNAFP